MSPTVAAPETAKPATLFSHPLVVGVLTPVVLAVVFGAGTVWMTQAALIGRVENLKTAAEANKLEADRQVTEIKSQIVPRGEHQQRWDAVDVQLRDIKAQGAHTNERVDKIYDLLLGRAK